MMVKMGLIPLRIATVALRYVLAGFRASCCNRPSFSRGYSGCADAFDADLERSIARFHPPAFSLYTRTELGIHGASDDSVPNPFPGQEEYLDYYRRMLGAEG
ncbi:MAG TPA: hypothetical protein VEY92_07910 [Pseudoxanthomonas sp.]|nr:hypothetical protein [Pseudoxanthomonas sp.]